MSVTPAMFDDLLLSAERVAVNARARRRRAHLRALLVAMATVLVLAGLLALPLYLLAALSPWRTLPVGAWDELGVLFAGTLRAAACAVLVALPLGIATAFFTAHFCAPRLRAWIKPSVEIFEAIPTVVLGLVAMATLAPWFKTHVASVLACIAVLPALLFAAGFAFGTQARGDGWLPLWLLPALIAVMVGVVALGAHMQPAWAIPSSPWNAALVGLALGFAALPLVFSLAEDALFLVPRGHVHAALALGATRWQALTTVVLPAAGSGLLAACVLGLSRCLGETMIVLMASGNTPIAGVDPLTGLRSLSAQLALGMPEAAPASDTYRSLVLAALALLALGMILSLVAESLRTRLRRRLHAGSHAA